MLIGWEKVKPWSQGWLIAAGAYPDFCSMKRLEVFLLPFDGMQVHRRSLPRNLSGFLNNLLVPIYTPGRRETLWELSVFPRNTTPCPWPGLEPGPLAPESSALTMRPPRRPWLAESKLINPKQCRKLKLNWLTGKSRNGGHQGLSGYARKVSIPILEKPRWTAQHGEDNISNSWVQFSKNFNCWTCSSQLESTAPVLKILLLPT